MLRAIPRHRFSSDFTVFSEGRAIADVGTSRRHEVTELFVGETAYKVYKAHFLSNTYMLEANGIVLAYTKRQRPLSRTFEITFEGRTYTLMPERLMSRTFVLSDGTQTLGRVTPEALFSRNAVVDLPEHFPVSVRMFIFWLVAVLGRQDRLI